MAGKFNSPKQSSNQFATTIVQATVLEVIHNPIQWGASANEALAEVNVPNAYVPTPPFTKTPYFKSETPAALRKQIRMAPRNSVVAVVQGGTSPSPKVFYPMFSGHLSLPVKPGENVWILSPKLTNTYSNTQKDPEAADLSASTGEALCDGYWLSRVSAPIYADDLNFTHSDRSRSVQYTQQQKNPLTNPTAAQPQHFHNGIFPNGGLAGKGEPTTYTLPEDNDYERIYKESLSSILTSRHPVPDYYKNPGDVLIQGSNNALICIGEDKSAYDALSTKPREIPGTAKPEVLKGGAIGRGTIDIVTGRCSLPATPTLLDPTQITFSPNTRTPELEKEKRTWAKSILASKENQGEQTVGFTSDLARIYVSSETDGDTNFGHDPAAAPPYQFGTLPTYLSPVKKKPYVAMRSDEIRIIARKPPAGSAGSIRIIKEGVPNTDQSLIAMQSDGTIHVDGPKISLGTSQLPGAPGAGSVVFIGGTDAKESMVLGDELVSLLTSLVDALINNQAAFVATGVGPGTLNPAVVSTASQIKGQLGAKKILSSYGKLK
jgi:hypothetical protein